MEEPAITNKHDLSQNSPSGVGGTSPSGAGGTSPSGVGGGVGGVTWFPACTVEDVPANGGVCVKYNDEQIALFHFTRRGEWYATQNECPHRQQMALSRGMIGTQDGEPKVACPFHKKTFSLVTGECLQGDECAIKTYPVKVKDGMVYIGFSTN